jgi:uncharacterized protein (TIGR02453 family)
MLQSSTLQFLEELQRNNNRSWFEGHRPKYENARADFFTMVEALIKAISKFDAPIGQLTVKDSIFRINRDVRFSKDKRPYKNHFSCYFNKDGKKGQGAGYYLHIEPRQSFAAGGIWMPEPPVLAGIRQEIDYNFAEWKRITGEKVFKKMFPAGVTSEEVLVRAPKGYDEDNPALQFLKMKSFTVSKTFGDREVLASNFVKEAGSVFKSMKPFVDFLNTALH